MVLYALRNVLICGCISNFVFTLPPCFGSLYPALPHLVSAVEVCDATGAE